MSATQSMASFLPSIRCSDCGVDVELSMMGEHVCSKLSEGKMYSPRSVLYANVRTKAALFTRLGTEQVVQKALPEAASDRPYAFKAAKAPPLPRLQTNAIGIPQRLGHSPTAADSVQVDHWSYQTSLHLRAAAGDLIRSPQ